MSGQGDLFVGRAATRSTVETPRGGRGNNPPDTNPGRRGSSFADRAIDAMTPGELQQRRDQLRAMEGIALELGSAPDRPAGYFALWEIRAIAVERGILTGTEGAPNDAGRNVNPRALAWLGALLPGMARAGLIERHMVDGRPQFDTSPASRAHGNKNVLWRLTPDGRTAARVR